MFLNTRSSYMMERKSCWSLQTPHTQNTLEYSRLIQQSCGNFSNPARLGIDKCTLASTLARTINWLYVTFKVWLLHLLSKVNSKTKREQAIFQSAQLLGWSSWQFDHGAEAPETLQRSSLQISPWTNRFGQRMIQWSKIEKAIWNDFI